MNSQKVANCHFRYSELDPESSNLNTFWIPAFVGMTMKKSFYETIKQELLIINF